MAYFFHEAAGLKKVSAVGDGTSVVLEWFPVYPSITTNAVAITIYHSTSKDNLYYEGIKLIYNGNDTSLTLTGFPAGDLTFFAIRPFEYNPTFNWNDLTNTDINQYVLPETLLASNITDTDLAIPVLDASSFPAQGTILLGSELISYSSKTGNTLNVSVNGRGFNNTVARIHGMDGWDGNPALATSLQWLFYRRGPSLWIGGDDPNFDKQMMCEVRFDYPHFPGNTTGYNQVVEDIVDVDLEWSDTQQIGFPAYDYAGYHRQDPAMLIKGECIGSYQGGEMYCQDDENGVGQVLRGVSLQDRNNQRQEMITILTGRPCVLLQRQMTGITCKCMVTYQNSPDPLCEVCIGSGFVTGWVQYFFPRNSDGRLLVRFDPYKDTIRREAEGMDPEIQVVARALTVPTIKPRDILVKYELTGEEEFRYEVTGVTRNDTYLGNIGGQKLDLTRIRKTDPVYKIYVFSNTATMPTWIDTGTMIAEPGHSIPTNLMNHSHRIRGNENARQTWAQQTQVSAGHNHRVIVLNGILTVEPILNHTHII